MILLFAVASTVALLAAACAYDYREQLLASRSLARHWKSEWHERQARVDELEAAP